MSLSSIEQRVNNRLRRIFSLKTASALTSAVFLGSTLCAPVVEANFWQDRKLAAAARQHAGEETVSRPGGKIFAQLPLPVPEQIGRALPMPVEFSPVQGLASAAAPKTPSLWPAWLPPLPSAYGDIRSVNILPGSQKPLVILIQDAHDIHSAQLNISRMLSHIAHAAPKPFTVGVEGSAGRFDFSPFRDPSDATRQEAVANFLLEQGLILGTEHFAILAATVGDSRGPSLSDGRRDPGLSDGTETKEPILWGVEEPSLYARNVQAYRDSLPVKSALGERIRSLEESLKPLKERVFSLKLWALDQHLSAYHKGEEDLLAYINFLVGASHDTGLSDGVSGAGKNVSLASFGEVEKLSRALAMEKSLDFARVGTERLAFIEELSGRVSDRDLDGLLRLSLDFRAGKMNYKTYYESLRRLAEDNDLSLGRYPSLDAYIRYGLLAESIDRYKLFDQVDRFRNAVAESLSSTAEQKELIRMGDDLRLLDRLMRQEFGPAEWKVYSRRKTEIASLPERAAELSAKVGVHRPAHAALGDLLPAFENFYSAAEERNNVLVENLLKKMSGTPSIRHPGENRGPVNESLLYSGFRRNDSQVAVLVAGGFHTESLEKIFASKGLSTLTFTPRMEIVNAKNGSKYLDAFAMNRTPLEKLLLGEKLDLNTPGAACVATRTGEFSALSTKAEHAAAVAATAYVAAQGDSRQVAELAREKNAVVSQFELKGPFAGFNLKFSDGTSVTVGTALVRTGQILDEVRNAAEHFLLMNFSGLFSRLTIVLNAVMSNGENDIVLVAGGTSGGFSGLSFNRGETHPVSDASRPGILSRLVADFKWEIISLPLLLIASAGGILAPPAALAILLVRPILYLSVAGHGLGHALTMAFFDTSVPFLSSVKKSMSSYIGGFRIQNILAGKPPSMQNPLTNKNSVRVTALMGPVMTFLFAFVLAPAVGAWLGPTFSIAVEVLKTVNIALLVLSLSDLAALFAGVAFQFNCGNFGILAKRIASDEGLFPMRFESMWLAMGGQTDVRGQQAGGTALLTRHKSGSVFIARKIVNRKRDNLTASLIDKFKSDVKSARRTSKPFEKFFHLIAHYRYGTSSAPAVIETHWHRWTQPHAAPVWVLSGGRLVKEKKNIDNLITHNGDFDYWDFPWGREENNDPRGGPHKTKKQIRQAMKNPPKNSLVGFLTRILGVTNEALGDSPKIAGMMDLLLTQGQAEASLRLAYVLHRATSLEDIPDPKFLKDLSAIFEEELTGRMTGVSIDGATSLSDIPRSRPDDVERLSNDILAAIEPQTLNWTDAQRKAFVYGAVDYFFRNDLFQASKMFMSRAVGSFGLITTSSLAPGQIVMNCYKQPLSIGASPKAGLMMYASEPTAIKAAASSLGGISEIPYRYDLRDDELALLEVSEDEAPNRVTVYDQKRLETTVYDLTEERLSPEERWIDTRDNPYISDFTYTTPEDRVKEEMNDIPLVLEKIKRDWKNKDSFNRQTADDFARIILQKAEKYGRERNGEAIDLLIIGQENSLYLSSDFERMLKQTFPFLNIVVEDSAAFAASPQNFAIGPETVVLGVSQSGQTFNTLDSIKFLQELHDAGKCGDVFVLTGQLETLMGAATGQSLRANAPFKKRIFTNLSGWRVAEPSTVTSAATFATMNQILIHTAETLRKAFPKSEEHPFGLRLSMDEIDKLRLMSDGFIERSESIIGVTKNGGELKTQEHTELVATGRRISQFVTEATIVSLLSLANIFITLGLGMTPVTLLMGPLSHLPLMGFVILILQTAYYYFLAPLSFFLLVRAIQRRPITDRLGPRSIVIKDTYAINKLAEAYLSKLFSLSYGVATFAGIHAADNHKSQSLHEYGHRVVRGTLILHGLPDGRVNSISRAQAGAAMTSKQAQGVQNLGTGAYVMGIGKNPGVAPKFNHFVQLGQTAGKTLPPDPALGSPDIWSEDLQLLAEEGFGAFERLLAFYVTFHATAESTARFINILPIFVHFLGGPIFWLLKIITRGRIDIYVGKWDFSRTQSGTRIATTADPVPAILLSAEDYVSLPLSAAGGKTDAPAIVVPADDSIIQPALNELMAEAIDLGAPDEDIDALHRSAMETVRTGGGYQTAYAALLAEYVQNRRGLLARTEALNMPIEEALSLTALQERVAERERLLAEPQPGLAKKSANDLIREAMLDLHAPAGDIEPIQSDEAALRQYVIDRMELLSLAEGLDVRPTDYAFFSNEGLRRLLEASVEIEPVPVDWSSHIESFLLNGGVPLDALAAVYRDLREMSSGTPVFSLNGYHEHIEPDLAKELMAHPEIMDLILGEFGITLDDERLRAAAIDIFVQTLMRRPDVILPRMQEEFPDLPTEFSGDDIITPFVEAVLIKEGLMESFQTAWIEFIKLTEKTAALGLALSDNDLTPANLHKILYDEWHRRLVDLAKAMGIDWFKDTIGNDRLLEIIDVELRKPADQTWIVSPEQLETFLRILNDAAILQEKDGAPMSVNEFIHRKQGFVMKPPEGATRFRLDWNPRENIRGEKAALRYSLRENAAVLDPRYAIPDAEAEAVTVGSPANLSDIATQPEEAVGTPAPMDGGEWPLFRPFYNAAAAVSRSFGHVFLPTLFENLLPAAGLMALTLNAFTALSTALPAFASPLVLIAVYPAAYFFIGLWSRLHGAETSERVKLIATRTRLSLIQAVALTSMVAVLNPAMLPIIAPAALLIALSLPHINANFAALAAAPEASFETALNKEFNSPRQSVQLQILKALSGERLGSLLQFSRRYDAFDKDSLRSRVLSGSDAPEALFGERFKRAYALADDGVRFRTAAGEFILAAFGGALPARNTAESDRAERIEMAAALVKVGTRGPANPARTAGLIRAAEKFRSFDPAAPFESGTVLIVNLHEPDADVLKNLSAILAANGDDLRVILATGGNSLAQVAASHPELDLSPLRDPRVVPVTIESVRLLDLLNDAGVPLDTVQRLRILETVNAGTPWDTTDLPEAVANAIEVILSIMEGMALTAPLRDTTNFAIQMRAFATAA